MGSQRVGHNTRNTHSGFIKIFHDYIICCKFNKIQKLYQHLPNKNVTKVDIWIANKHMKKCSKSFSSVRFSWSSHVQLSSPWTAARQASLCITNSRSLPKLMPVESVMPSNHHIICSSLLLLPSIFPSTRVFSSGSNESAF